jgi:putative alpha-1,2-mannosidase
MIHGLRRVLPVLLLAAWPAPARAVPPGEGVSPPAKDRLKDVDSLIGTAGSDTLPVVTRPFGFTQWTAVTRDHLISVRPYHYDDARIQGFLGTHQPAIWMGDYGYVKLMPGAGPVVLGQSLPFRHADESATPQRYRVGMQAGSGRITAEVTASEHSALMRFTFPPGKPPFFVLEAIKCRNFEHTTCPGVPGASEVRVDEREIVGRNPDRQSHALGPALPSFAGYFVVQFDRPFAAAVGSWEGDRLRPGLRAVSGLHVGSYVTFPAGTREVRVRIGTSFIGVDQARESLLREVPGWDLDALAAEGAAAWNALLNRIDVEGGTPEQRRSFYTALFHTLLYPRMFSEGDDRLRYYSAFDDRVHDGVSYNDFSLWDTFRAEHPLLTLVAPERANDMVKALVQMDGEGGRLPLWPNPTETNIMIASHADCVIADAFVKGLRGFDVQKAYTAVRRDAMVPPPRDTTTRWVDRAPWLGPPAPADGVGFEARGGLTYYLGLGYVPYDKTDESVSRTVEFGIDDYCAARMARELQPEDADVLMKRASSYRALFNPATGMLAPRASDGTWGPDPTAGFTEGSPWTYLFGAMHDPEGMIGLFGGSERFVARLDENFERGHYVHENEPGHHYAYLYDYAGQAWKTQERVRAILGKQYQPTPRGLKGDDDCGQMSAWYVFSALGFYPVVPASGAYALASPLFDRATLYFDAPYPRGRFTIVVRGQSPGSVYIQSALLNGKPLARPFLDHADLVAGDGVLEITLGPRPNRNLWP